MKKQDHSRFIVGIDLGTTTISLSYLDTLEENPQLKTLPITQWEEEGKVVEREILPSFCYIAQKKEVKRGSFLLPFYQEKNSPLSEGELVLGRYAQNLQNSKPERIIHSAKSWLCHTGVSREDKILPWNSDELTGNKRFEPAKVLSFFLAHLKEQWNSTIAEHSKEYRLEKQRLIITVPASFDEVASQLTLKAASLAGLKEESLSLVEEPQAAFYTWLKDNKKSEELNQLFSKKNQLSLLVCDIGGGTSDFSLFRLFKATKEELQIERVKVSRHILLGGDNLDLKTASLFEEAYQKESGQSFSSKEWAKIVTASRNLKESLFTQQKEYSEKVHISFTKEGSSRNLFTSSQTLSLDKKDLTKKLLESFFPHAEKNTVSKDSLTQTGLKELGLPYAKDPAFTHHLSEFLKEENPVDAVLFVGGTLVPRIFRERILEDLSSWQESKVVPLNQNISSSVVSKGASLYGSSLRNPKELSISSGYPRSLYLEVLLEKEKNKKVLLCLIPKGHQRNDGLINLSELNLKVALNKEISFNLYSSSERPKDKPGSLISFDNDNFQLVAPLQTKIEGKKKKKESFYDISLTAGLSETGLLKISCERKENPEEKWDFSFNAQESSLAKREKENRKRNSFTLLPCFAEENFEKAHETLSNFYGKTKKPINLIEKPKSSKILKDFESLFSADRKNWSLDSLRKLAISLIENKSTRGRSEQHESAWFNLCGYFLRPGYGHPLDRSNINELFKLFEEGLRNKQVTQVENEWWVFWRRVSGGLSKEQQERIFDKIFPKVRSKQATAEMIMTLGSFELVNVDKKARLADDLCDTLLTRGSETHAQQKIWALTRICSRNLLYSGPENILRPYFLETVFEKLSELPGEIKTRFRAELSKFYLYSGRKVEDREFDLTKNLQEKALSELRAFKNKEEEIKVVSEFTPLKETEQKQLMGDSVPVGLFLVDSIF